MNNQLQQAFTALRQDIDSVPIPELVTVEQAQKAIKKGKRAAQRPRIALYITMLGMSIMLLAVDVALQAPVTILLLAVFGIVTWGCLFLKTLD